MGKMKERQMTLDYLNTAACLNGMVVRLEAEDGEYRFNLYPIDSEKLIASYENEDSMFGFLDGLDYNRTGRGPAE